MTATMAKDMIRKWKLRGKAKERVKAEKEAYTQKVQEIKQRSRVYQQPSNRANGCCLIASVVNCMRNGRERAAVLGKRGQADVDTKDLSTYAEYQTYYLKHHPKATGHQYSVRGLRHWLEHLVRSKCLTRFVLKRCDAFKHGLASLLSSRMDSLKGKSFVATCYRRGSGSRQEDYERLYKYSSRAQSLARALSTLDVSKNNGAKGTGLWVQRQKMALEYVLDRWQAGKQDCDPPVQQLRRSDFEDLRQEAVKIVLGDHGTLAEWMVETGRDVASFQLEVVYQLQALKVEKEQTHAAHLEARNKSDKRSINEVTQEVRAEEPPKKKQKHVEGEAAEENEQTPQWSPRCGGAEFERVRERMSSVKKGCSSATSTPLSRHAIAMHVTEDGDVVIADPASITVRVLSRKNVTESCQLFCETIADFDDVFEISVAL
eukprot:gene11568-12954_t